MDKTVMKMSDIRPGMAFMSVADEVDLVIAVRQDGRDSWITVVTDQCSKSRILSWTAAMSYEVYRNWHSLHE